MRRFKFYLGIGYANAAHKEIVEVPDDYTDEDIDELFNGWMWNYIDAGYEEIKRWILQSLLKNTSVCAIVMLCVKTARMLISKIPVCSCSCLSCWNEPMEE